MKVKITASIVLYKNDPDIVLQAINSFLQSETDCILFVIDNSPQNSFESFIIDSRIQYIFNGKNLGFGTAHNIALKRSMEYGAKYHVVINPDVYFSGEVIHKLTELLENHSEIGLAMPKVLYPDGRLQPLCKLLPSPATLFFRRFSNLSSNLFANKNSIYELQFSGYDKLMDVPFLSGCFMFLRIEAVKKIGFFDERIFLYTEDIDLTRRMHQYYRTVFYPDVNIFHLNERRSYKDLRALVWHIKSAITYFNKWGWFNDRERKEINRTTLLKLTQ
jgi:GT2 family glycosyltransferase